MDEELVAANVVDVVEGIEIAPETLIDTVGDVVIPDDIEVVNKKKLEAEELLIVELEMLLVGELAMLLAEIKTLLAE
jgi:hypothetical protein